MSEPEPTGTPSKYTDWGPDFQRKIVALTMRDTIFAQRTDGLIKPEFFDNEAHATLAAIALDYYATYKKAPDRGSIPLLFKKAVADRKIRKDLIADTRTALGSIFAIDVSDRDFVCDQVADFAKNQAMIAAITASVGYVEKGDYAAIDKAMREALIVGTNDDGGEYDYFAEIGSRTDHRVAMAAGTIRPDGIPTGCEELDKALFHGGWGRKELSAIMGRAKFGKSMALGEFGANAAMLGYPTLICTCEVSSRIYSDRLDANLSDTAMKMLKDSPFAVKAKIEAAWKRAAPFKLQEYASGTLKPSQLRRLLERYRTRGVIFDLIIVDYADIMAAERYTGEPREDSRTIWLDLRAIAFEQNAAVLTATQTNREGAKKMTAVATDVAEDYNKIRIADLVISGNATEDEIAAGEARLSLAASRNQEEIMLRIQQDRSRMKFIKKVLGKS